MKKQILVIHGGDTFNTHKDYVDFLKNLKIDFEKFKIKRWKDTLGEKLGEDFEVISPKMPNSMNAKYNEWKIMFDKLLPFLSDNIILIGHSLGGIFLAKYLSENIFPKKILATFLIAAPYNGENQDHSLGDFVLSGSLEKFQEQGGKIFIYNSKDDPVVQFDNSERYKYTLPRAVRVEFEDRGHFDQIEFPELIKNIHKLYSN